MGTSAALQLPPTRNTGLGAGDFKAHGDFGGMGDFGGSTCAAGDFAGKKIWRWRQGWSGWLQQGSLPWGGQMKREGT